MEYLTTKIGVAVLVPFMVLFEWPVDPVGENVLAEPNAEKFRVLCEGMKKEKVWDVLGKPSSSGRLSRGSMETWKSANGDVIILFFFRDPLSDEMHAEFLSEGLLVRRDGRQQELRNCLGSPT